MASFNLPDNEKLAAKVIDAQSKENTSRIEQGILGRLWGGSHATRNITGLFIFTFAMLFAYLILAHAGSKEFPLRDAIASVVSLITLGFGYLVGKESADKGS